MTDHTVTPDKLRQAWDHAKLLKQSGYLPEELAAMVEVILSLPTLPLPTLAEMTQEDREACQWMQADVEGLEAGVIAYIAGNEVFVCFRDGEQANVFLDMVTPRPDLPPMVWPADEPEHGPFPDEEAREDADRLVAAHTDGEDKPEAECECSPTQPESWTTHAGSVDPATMMEYEPSCPVHGVHYWDGEKYQLKPRPDSMDIAPGEAWLFKERDGENVAGFRVRDTPDDAFLLSNGRLGYRFRDESEVEPVTRLVPEQQPRTLTTIEDYEDAPVGTVAAEKAADVTWFKFNRGEWHNSQGGVFFNENMPHGQDNRCHIILRWGWGNEEVDQ